MILRFLACLLLLTSIGQNVVAEENGEKKYFGLELKDYRIGRQWERVLRKGLKQSANAYEEIRVRYSVIEGFDGLKQSDSVVIEAEWLEPGAHEKKVRIVLSKDGIFSHFLLRRNDKWVQYSKVNFEDEDRAQIFILNSPFLNYVFLPLPIRWENSIENTKIFRNRDAVVTKAVFGDEMIVTCAIKMQEGEVAKADMPVKGELLHEVFILKFKKGEPWATHVESTRSNEFYLSTKKVEGRE